MSHFLLLESIEFLLHFSLRLNFLVVSKARSMQINAENGGYPPTQNGDIRSLF